MTKPWVVGGVLASGGRLGGGSNPNGAITFATTGSDNVNPTVLYQDITIPPPPTAVETALEWVEETADRLTEEDHDGAHDECDSCALLLGLQLVWKYQHLL